jgi:hypothetical protein
MPYAMELLLLFPLLQQQALQQLILTPGEVFTLIFSFSADVLWEDVQDQQQEVLKFSVIKFFLKRQNNKFYSSDVPHGVFVPPL